MVTVNYIKTKTLNWMDWNFISNIVHCSTDDCSATVGGRLGDLEAECGVNMQQNYVRIFQESLLNSDLLTFADSRKRKWCKRSILTHSQIWRVSLLNM